MSAVNSTNTSVRDLVDSLWTQFEGNADVQVSTEEFSRFLTKLLSGIGETGGSANAEDHAHPLPPLPEGGR